MAEPVTLAQARQQVRIYDPADTSEDSLLTTYISAARAFVEQRAGLVLVEREFTEEHKAVSGYITLTRRPATEVSAVAYTDSDGEEQAYADSRLVDGRVYAALNDTWPYPAIGGFRVTYTAGLTAGQLAGDDYKDLLAAILLLVAHWFANREAVSDRPANEAPFAVAAICDQYRQVVV